MSPSSFPPSILLIPALAFSIAGCVALAESPTSVRAKHAEFQTSEEPRLAVRTASPGKEAGRSSRVVSTEGALASRSRGAAWIKGVQKADGGWGAGAWGTDDPSAPSDVATTSLAILALHRDAAGRGIHDESINKAIRYVAGVVESSPPGPRLQVPDSTQPQYKLGRLVDTHFAALMLGEMSGTRDEATEAVLTAALENTIKRVQLAQAEDGSFDRDGWAPVLSSSVAASSLYKAQELGLEVDEEVLARNESYQRGKVKSYGSGSAGGAVLDSTGGAGVDLYSAATTLKGNREAQNRVAAPEAARKASKDAEDAAYGRIAGAGSEQLFAGFGSVGGEEMLSYMMISDTLADDGGEKFEQWNNKVSTYLAGIQNKDGSWAGHHCITSRTFVTAAALMSLGAADAATMRASRKNEKKASEKRAANHEEFAPDHGTVN